jgi:hypothetical protein
MPIGGIFSFQRVYRQAIRKKTELMAAADALSVIEVNGLAAMVAGEKPHASPRKNYWPTVKSLPRFHNRPFLPLPPLQHPS